MSHGRHRLFDGNGLPMITVGKWQIWKCQDADSIHHGYWLTNSPWYLKNSHYIKDLAGFYTWQEAIDHINDRMAAQ